MDRWYKEPLLHFFILGCLLFFFMNDSEDRSAVVKKEIVISLNQLSQLSSSWREKRDTPPTKKELDTLITFYVEDEILYREALRLGLDRDEPLIKKILVNKMKYIASDGVDLSKVSDKELHHFFKTHKERFSAPSEKISFSHIYFNPTKDIKYTEHANELFSAIKGQSYLENTCKQGNTFYGGKHFTNVTKKELREYFSQTFIEDIFHLDVKKWSQPINSAYGRHIIYVHQREESKNLEYKDVEQSVKDAWLIDANANAYKRLYQRLKKEYHIVIETDQNE